MSTARAPVRWSGATRPICQSHRIGWPVESRCGGAQQVPWHATGRRERHDPPREPACRLTGRVGDADDDPVRAEPEPARGDDLAPRHSAPGAAVDPVAKPRTAVGSVEVRRRDREPLARGAGALRRQAVHKRRRRRAAARVGRHDSPREHVAAGAENPERERGGIGLDDLGRRLDELQPPARVGVGDRVVRRRKRRRRRPAAGQAAPAGRRARAPLVGDLEAQEPIARGEMPGVPPKARGADDAAVAQDAGDLRAADGDGRPDPVPGVRRNRRVPARRRRLRGRPGGGEQDEKRAGAPERHRIPSGRAGPCASISASTIWTVWSGVSVADVFGSSRAAWTTCSRLPSSAARTASSHTFR